MQSAGERVKESDIFPHVFISPMSATARRGPGGSQKLRTLSASDRGPHACANSLCLPTRVCRNLSLKQSH